MSGIAALFHPNGKPINEELIKDMACLMTRRGPEKQQFWATENIALAHCLLPTTNESLHENQPSSLKGDIWITADARIDAREDLIRKLKTRDCVVTSKTSDDKLILCAYQTWGIECLQHLIGDFSFIIWDPTKQRLFCATDQFGVSPLYYSETSAGICVSNTMNAIRLHPDVSNNLNQLAIADYLLFRTNENNSTTLFQSIKHLPASHYLLIENEKISIKKYWQLTLRKALHRASEETYVEEFNELLINAVKDRVRTPNVSTHLSGGMDSSSITAICQELRQHGKALKKIKSYTYGGSGTLPDLESPLARGIAEKFDIEHTILPSPNNLEAQISSPDLLFPEPRFFSRKTAAYDLLNQASAHGPVLLSGFGGDPLLMGSPLALADIKNPVHSAFLFSKAWQHYRINGKRPSLGIKRRFKINSGVNRAKELPTWINPQFALENNLNEHIDNIGRKKQTNQRASMNTGSLWRRIFCWNDPGFTHIPIKVCHPFFDVRLVEFAESLPPFPTLHDKSILRKAMQHRLPKEVLTRPKTPLPGNGLQSISNLQGKLPDAFSNLIGSAFLEPFISSKYFSERLTSLELCKKNDFKAIMRVSTLAHWFEEHVYWDKTTVRSIGLKSNVTRITSQRRDG